MFSTQATGLRLRGRLHYAYVFLSGAHHDKKNVKAGSGALCLCVLENTFSDGRISWQDLR